jgi:hypothetical protein
MRTPLWLNLLAAALFAASSSCCVEQCNHSVRRMWCDYNTFRAPALSFEQVDHLPYPAAQVGYYKWMYDKDPGHQLAALGPVTAPACVVPQCVPPGNDPFEYQVAFPTGVPNHTDSLWAEGQPEPINVPRGQPGDAPNANGSTGKDPQSGMLTVPMAPVLTPPGGDKRTFPAPQPAQPKRAGQPSVEPPGSLLPGFDSSPPPPHPVDEDVPPMLGPASQSDPNLRLTTGSPASQPTPSPATNALWPR